MGRCTVNDSDPFARAAELVSHAEEITVLTGAGISTDSGIPDFRGPNGLWTKNPAAQRLSSLQEYETDPQLRRESWRRRSEHPVWDARPNPAHAALVELERAGRLRAIITQNIDGLHQRAGNDPALVLELHGTMHAVVCLSCGDRTPMTEALARVEAGEPDPPCLRCGGILKSATISFGQRLDETVFRAAAWAASDCDVLLAVGSSLTVEPAAGLVAMAANAGARVVILNAQSTPYDGLAAVVLRAPIGDTLPLLLTANATSEMNTQ
jgi:NAD-dependent protein deacetylase/lipoamidase